MVNASLEYNATGAVRSVHRKCFENTETVVNNFPINEGKTKMSGSYFLSALKDKLEFSGRERCAFQEKKSISGGKCRYQDSLHFGKTGPYSSYKIILSSLSQHMSSPLNLPEHWTVFAS